MVTSHTLKCFIVFRASPNNSICLHRVASIPLVINISIYQVLRCKNKTICTELYAFK